MKKAISSNSQTPWPPDTSACRLLTHLVWKTSRISTLAVMRGLSDLYRQSELAPESGAWNGGIKGMSIGSVAPFSLSLSQVARFRSLLSFHPFPTAEPIHRLRYWRLFYYSYPAVVVQRLIEFSINRDYAPFDSIHDSLMPYFNSRSIHNLTHNFQPVSFVNILIKCGNFKAVFTFSEFCLENERFNTFFDVYISSACSLYGFFLAFSSVFSALNLPICDHRVFFKGLSIAGFKIKSQLLAWICRLFCQGSFFPGCQ